MSSEPPSVRRRLPGMAKKDGYTLHPWDLANGVRTSGLVAGRHLKSGHPHDRHATAYFGVAPSVFHAFVKRWRRTGSAGSIEQTTFVDIGAGMGRGVLLGAQMRFRRVIGVELHPVLAGIARANVRVWKRTGLAVAPIEIVQGDALDLPLPPGPCVAFLFNPFGATVMRRWLKVIAKYFADRPGELDILYVNNEQEGELESVRGFRRLFLGKVNRSRADAAADRRILANQPDGEYASAPYEDCSIWRWAGRSENRG